MYHFLVSVTMPHCITCPRTHSVHGVMLWEQVGSTHHKDIYKDIHAHLLVRLQPCVCAEEAYFVN